MGESYHRRPADTNDRRLANIPTSVIPAGTGIYPHRVRHHDTEAVRHVGRLNWLGKRDWADGLPGRLYRGILSAPGDVRRR